MRAILLSTVVAFAACGLEPVLPPLSRLGAFQCGDDACTQLGARLAGLPPRTGLFMVGAWFRGTHDVHWALRWPGESVFVDFASLRDSSIVAARLDSIPLTTVLVLTVSLGAGGRDSLFWDFR